VNRFPVIEDNGTECCSNVVFGSIVQTTGLFFIDSETEEFRPAETTQLRLCCGGRVVEGYPVETGPYGDACEL
jgi:hypothetical protein